MLHSSLGFENTRHPLDGEGPLVFYEIMSRRRFGAALALLFLLAGPLGLLAAEHGAFHHAGTDEHGAPCPVCHFLSTTSLESPTPGFAAAVLVLVGIQPAAPAALLADALTQAPCQSRAPPSLLS
jgi:hypothetical protein